MDLTIIIILIPVISFFCWFCGSLMEGKGYNRWAWMPLGFLFAFGVCVALFYPEKKIE